MRRLPFSLKQPHGWNVMPFGRVVIRSQVSGTPDACPLSVFIDQGVVPRDSREDNFNRLGADLAKYLVVRKGDIVFNKLRTWQGGLGVSRYDGIVSPAYFVCRPRFIVEPRYVHHLLRSRIYLEELTRISKWMPPSQFDISWDDLRALPVLIPPLPEQRIIADYLDRETARIDALISAKRRVVKLLEERTWVAFSERVAKNQPLLVPLRRVLSSLIDGPFGSAFSSSDYSDAGAVVIRLGNIGFGRYRSANEARIPMDMFQAFRQYQVNQGDLLIAGLGDDRNHAGRACVAPDLGPAIVKGKCFRGRVIPDRANAEFLALLLSSPLGAEVMSVSGRGSTRSMINLEIVKNTEIPLPERRVQDSIMAGMKADEVQTGEMTGVLGKQLGLLLERRQTLITAAVTGQLEIPETA